MPFYQCKGCQKKWQYPIGKCPHCFNRTERLEEKRARVIGISEVKIPTLLHPKVPYFVLVLEDKEGNRWTRKSFQKYQMGEWFNPVSGKGEVSIWRAKYDVSFAIKKVVELLGGIKVSSSSKILILPTLVSPQHPHFRENTSPQFLEGVLNYLLQKGAEPENIKVAGQSFNDFPIEASVTKSQLLRVCQENKVSVLNLTKSSFSRKESGEVRFEVSKEAFENDLIVNLPILKLDPELGVRGASENVLVLLRKENYLSLKYLYPYHRLIKGFQKIVPSFLTIGEALSIQKETKYTTFLDLVLAGFNPFLLERVLAEIIEKKGLPEYLKNIKIGDIHIAGRQIEELQYDIKRFY